MAKVAKLPKNRVWPSGAARAANSRRRGAAGAQPVVHHHRLAEPRGQLGGDQPGGNVEHAARPAGDHPGDAALGEIVRPGRRLPGQGRRGGERRPAGCHHAAFRPCRFPHARKPSAGRGRRNPARDAPHRGCQDDPIEPSGPAALRSSDAALAIRFRPPGQAALRSSDAAWQSDSDLRAKRPFGHRMRPGNPIQTSGPSGPSVIGCGLATDFRPPGQAALRSSDRVRPSRPACIPAPPGWSGRRSRR